MPRDIDLTFDIATGELTYGRTVGNYVKRMETVAMTVTILANGNSDTSITGATLTIKPVNVYDNVLASWTLAQVGSTNVLSGSQTLNSDAITTLLGTTNEKWNCVLDISTPANLESETLAIVLQNNVTRSTDGTPTPTAANISSSGYTMNTGRILARWSAGSGAIQEATIGSGLTLSALGVLSASGSGITINSTAITGGTTGRILYDNAGTVGEATTGAGVLTALGIAPNAAGGIMTFAGVTLSGSGSIANSGVSALTVFTGSGTSSGTNTGDNAGVTDVTGTANEITSTGGNTPVLSLPSSLTFTGKTVTGGAFSGVALTNGSTVNGIPFGVGQNFDSIGIGNALSIDSGGFNVVIGPSARGVSTGSFNTSVGAGVGTGVTGSQNCFFGENSGWNNIAGSNNSGYGHETLYSNVSGNGNIALGKQAGKYATGDDELFINNQDRNNISADRTQSIVYGVMSGVPASQQITFNVGTFKIANTNVITLKDYTITAAGNATVSGTNTGDQTSVSGNAGTATALANARTLWGQSFNGTANVTGSLTAVTDITGGASNMVITSGTGNSRTLTLRTTTSGGTATNALTLGADQTATFIDGTYTDGSVCLPSIHGTTDTGSGIKFAAGETWILFNSAFRYLKFALNGSAIPSIQSRNDDLALPGNTYAQNVTIANALITTPQALSGAGAVNVTTASTAYTSTGGAQALTLANGTAGQLKTICHVVDGGSGVLTPTTCSGFSTITFTNVGDSVTLQYQTTAGWCIVGIFGAVAA